MTDPTPTGPTPADPAPGDDRSPTLSESLSAAAKTSGFAQLNPGEAPSASAMLGVIGGVRGLVESIVPGFAFLFLFTFTGDLLVSVVVPVIIAIGFVVARAISRAPMTPALAGAIGIALTATLALVTNRAENNFLPGIIINAFTLLLLLVSIAVRWPFVGVIIGLLMSDEHWRRDRLKRRAFTLATWIWVIPSAVRVAVQVPLYLAERADILAASKLLTGIPLYFAALWVTWLLVRAVYKAEPKA